MTTWNLPSLHSPRLGKDGILRVCSSGGPEKQIPCGSLRPARTRAVELTTGIATAWLVRQAFDYGLYPFIIYKFGILKGGVAMALLSCAASIISIKAYDFLKRDWLGIEAIKELKAYAGGSKIRRITAWIMNKSDPIVFAFLSLKFDPFITTAYLRKGRYSGLTGRNAAVFVSSVALGNAYWAFACLAGISFFEWIWSRAVLLFT
jgi:hypothetical protein